MGIRFTCPQGHQLHVKSFLAGRRGICPECGTKVQIPAESTLASRRPARSERAAQHDRRRPGTPTPTDPAASRDFAEIELLLEDSDTSWSEPLSDRTQSSHGSVRTHLARGSRRRRGMNWWFVLLVVATLAMLPVLVYVLSRQ